MSCPNINSPDWIALVNKHGENKAWQIFAENNDEIPTIIDKPKVQDSVADTEIIPQNSTLQEMNKNPSASSEIINQLKKTFPDLNKDGKITYADILKGRGIEEGVFKRDRTKRRTNG